METKIEELEKEIENLESKEVKEVVKPEPVVIRVKMPKAKVVEVKEVARKRKPVVGTGKTINKEPFGGIERDKIVLMKLGRVCYNCLHEEDGKCKKWEFSVRPDQHCFKYEKGVRLDGRSGF